MWQAVNALESQPAAGGMGAGFDRADGGIKGQGMKSHVLQPLGWQVPIQRAAQWGFFSMEGWEGVVSLSSC